MAKNSVRDYSATNSSNTDIQSIDISEGCSPANINNAIREVMVDLKNVSTGAIALETPAADSLTVTGDLTVDTNTLKVDSTNNRVGVGTASPIGSLSTQCTAGNSNFALTAYHPTSTSSRTIAKFQSNVGGTQQDKVIINCDGSVDISGQATFENDVVLSNDAYLYSSNGGSGVRAGLFFDGTNQVVKGFTAGSERMRIDSSGNLMIGTTNSQYNGIGASAALTSFNNGVRFGANFGASTTGTQYTVVFSNPNGQIGGILVSGSATSYVASSDYRLKTAVNYDWDATTRLKQLKPARFKWIADGDDAVEVDGFLAHEAQAIVPESVTGTKDEVEVWKDGEELPDGVSVGDNKLDEDGNTIPVMQGIDQAKLVPLLCKTILELEARITALEAG